MRLDKRKERLYMWDDNLTTKIRIKLTPDEFVELLEYAQNETMCNCFRVIKDLESDNEYWFQFQRDRLGRISISEEDHRRIGNCAEMILDQRERITKIKLSLPSRFILVTCIACYLGWFSNSENDKKQLNDLLDRLKDSESDEFSFTRYETDLLVASINSKNKEYGCSDLELKAHEYLIDKLKRNFKEK